MLGHNKYLLLILLGLNIWDVKWAPILQKKEHLELADLLQEYPSSLLIVNYSQPHVLSPTEMPVYIIILAIAL